MTPSREAPLTPAHRLLLPPHPSEIYATSALCSCGEWQFDWETVWSMPYKDVLREHTKHAARAGVRDPEEPRPESDYEARVGAMTAAIHETCVLEWRAIAAVDPSRALTRHMADAHYGQAHDLVRRLPGLIGGDRVFDPWAAPDPSTALREAARDYLASDGSDGVYDARRMIEARDRLRAALDPKGTPGGRGVSAIVGFDVQEDAPE